MAEHVVPEPGTSASPPPGIVLSIIIANYNGCALLESCLDSIFRYPPSHPFEVFVVDDASSDGSAQMVSARFPQVHLLRNEENVHYGRSNNRALAQATGRYVYLLNNDTIMLEGAMDAMVAFLDHHPAVGVVGTKLLNGDGTVQASVKALPSAASALFGARSFFTKLFPNNALSRRHLLHLSRDMSAPFTAGYVSSASMTLRRAVAQQVGDLDERLSYHIDADYCKRVWDAGWGVYYLPGAAVIHFDHQGGTMITRRRRFKSLAEFHRGSYLYFRKHLIHRPWHPMHALLVVGLASRFSISLFLQVCREFFFRPRLAGRCSTDNPPRPESDWSERT